MTSAVSLIDLTVPRTRSSAGAATAAVEVPKMLATMTSARRRRMMWLHSLRPMFAWKAPRFLPSRRGSGQTYAMRVAASQSDDGVIETILLDSFEGPFDERLRPGDGRAADN